MILVVTMSYSFKSCKLWLFDRVVVMSTSCDLTIFGDHSVVRNFEFTHNGSSDIDYEHVDFDYIVDPCCSARIFTSHIRELSRHRLLQWTCERTQGFPTIASFIRANTSLGLKNNLNHTEAPQKQKHPPILEANQLQETQNIKLRWKTRTTKRAVNPLNDKSNPIKAKGEGYTLSFKLRS